MTSRTTSPRGIRARALGSGRVDTSVMVTVVVNPPPVFVNVPGLVKLGTPSGPSPRIAPNDVSAAQHGPAGAGVIGQPVELPLSSKSFIGPREEVARVKVVVSTNSWKVDKSNITSTLLKEDVTW